MATIGTGVVRRPLSQFAKTPIFSTCRRSRIERTGRRCHVLPRGRRRSVRHGRVGPAHRRHQGRRRARCSSSRPTAKFPRRGASWPRTSWCSKYFYGEVNTPRARAQRPAVDPSRQPHDRRLGHRRRLLRHGRRRRAVLSRADLALPAPARRVQLARLVQRRPVSPVRRQGLAVQLALEPETRRGRAAGESLRVSARLGLLHPERATTTWKTSWSWRAARPCCSSSARAPAPICRRCARTARSSPAAASPRARCRSCASTTRSPRWSRAAARPAAPPRCSRSRSGIPTSWSSSSARRRKRRRPGC